MIFSEQLIFSDDQAITATAASTNIINLGATGIPHGDAAAYSRDVGKGAKVPILVQVTEAFDSGANDGTLTIALELDSTSTITPDASIDLGTFAEADLVAGFQIPWDVLPKGVNLQYCQLKYTVAGSGNFTAGAITAGIVKAVQNNG